MKTSPCYLAAGAALALHSAAPAESTSGTLQAPPIVLLDNGTTTVEVPPAEIGPFLQPDLVEVTAVDPSLGLDIRYATANNFTGRPVYPEPRAFLQRPAAEALARAHARVRDQGYAMVIFDGYRPWAVTKIFWDITPAEKKEFVADPARGSRHNRGCAVDLTLCDLATSRPVVMPTDFDDFTSRSYPTYTGGTAESRRLRDLLRAAMEAEGFTVNTSEWWHFDYQGWNRYPILNHSFANLRRGTPGKR